MLLLCHNFTCCTRKTLLRALIQSTYNVITIHNCLHTFGRAAQSHKIYWALPKPLRRETVVPNEASAVPFIASVGLGFVRFRRRPWAVGRIRRSKMQNPSIGRSRARRTNRGTDEADGRLDGRGGRDRRGGRREFGTNAPNPSGRDRGPVVGRKHRRDGHGGRSGRTRQTWRTMEADGADGSDAGGGRGGRGRRSGRPRGERG